MLSMVGCNCGSGGGSAADMRADGPTGPRPPWSFDFGPVPDVNLASCQAVDTWVVGDGGSTTHDGGASGDGASSGSSKIAWRASLSTSSLRTPTALAAHDGQVFVMLSGEGLLVQSAKDGTPRWEQRVTIDGENCSTSGVHAAAGGVYHAHYVFMRDPAVLARRSYTGGKLVWQTTLSGPYWPPSENKSYGVAFFKDGSAVVAGSNLALTRISKDGVVQWSRKLHGIPYSLYVDGQQRVIVGLTQLTASNRTPGRVAAVGEDGVVLWERLLRHGSGAFVVPGPRGNVLVRAGLDGETALYSFDGSCGGEQWQILTKGTKLGQLGGPLVDRDGAALLLRSDTQGKTHLARISPAGGVLYDVTLDDAYGHPVTAGVLGADGVLYLLRGTPDATPGLTPAVEGIEAKTGKRQLLFSMPAGVGRFSHSAPLLLDGGLLVFGTLAGTGAPSVELIAIQTASPGLAPSAWPAPLGGNRRLSAAWAKPSER